VGCVEMTVKDIQLVGVPYSSIDDVWAEVEPMLKKGIQHGDGELDTKDILKMLIERSMQLWVLWDYDGDRIVMAGVTEIISYPRLKVCRAVVLGGERVSEWMTYIDEIERWAKYKGCDRMEAYGRRGLAKKMESIGYSNTYVVMRKTI
jgi:hypothetical protein